MRSHPSVVPWVVLTLEKVYGFGEFLLGHLPELGGTGKSRSEPE